MAFDVGSAVGYLLMDASGWTRGLSSAKQALDTFMDDSSTATDKISALGSAFKGVGTGLTTTVTAPLVGLGGVAVKTAADFEQAMAQVAAVARMDTASQSFQDLTDKAKEMGATTKFSASQAAEAFNYMAMAGWDAEQMMSGISGIMDLAAASGEDLATTSDIVTDALTAFGLSAADSGHFADVLAAASSSANTNVAMLGESFKYVAPVAGSMGYAVEDVSVALGLMANSGIKASRAGTSLRSLLTRLVKPTGEAATAVEDLRISVANADGTMKPFSQVLEELRAKFADLTDEEQTQYAAMLAGQEGMSGLLAIVNAAPADFDNLTRSINNADGAAKEMADKQLDTLEGKLTLLRSALEGLAISFGEVLIPMLTDFVQWVTGVVDKFNSMDESTREAIVKFGLLAAAIGPVLVVLGNVMSAVVKIGGALSQLSGFISGFTGSIGAAGGMAAKLGAAVSGIAAPVAAVIAAVVALTAAFKHLWDTNEEFRNRITEIWESIKNTFSEFFDGITERINALGFDFENFIEVVSALWEGFCELLGPLFIGVFNNVAIIIQTVLDLVLNILDVFIGLFTGNWEQFWSGVVGIFETLFTGVASWFENLLTTIGDFVNVILGWFGTSWQELWEGAVQWFNNFVQGIVDGFNSIVQWFVNLPETIGNAIDQAIAAISNFATAIWDGLVNGVSSAVDTVVSWFTSLPERISYALGFAIGYISTWAQEAYDYLTTAIPEAIDSVVTWFSELPGRIWEWLTSVIDSIVQWGQAMWQAFSNWWGGLINSLAEWFTSLPGMIAEWLTSTINVVVEWGASLIEAATVAVGGFVASIVEWLSGIPGAFMEWLTQALDWLLSLPQTLYDIGANMLSSLWEGMKSIVTGIFDWIGGVVDRIVGAFTGGVQDGISQAEQNAQKVSGSYATGLDYVPRDMNVRVHEGERILTKQENQQYNGNGGSPVMPENMRFEFNIPIDGEIVGHAVYNYNTRERTLRGEDLVEEGTDL